MKYLLLIATTLVVFACNNGNHRLSDSEYAKLPEDERRKVENALEGIDLLDDELEITLFASEPMMRNPTNMDIDSKGRVWICEGYNYRNGLNPRNPYDKKGDRILIMEDTDGDGVADKEKVFYQGEDIDAALGIAVIGSKIYVSRSPYVYVFTDADGDDVPEKKEILFSGIGGEQHDHGMHAMLFGPDGKLYFNYGNEGKGILTANGKPIFDPNGKPVNNTGKPYREGMVFRSNPDGTDAEILGWNFRNNFELAVDSYGRMWQSDNDDDGNRGVRINYVMDYGNYGYRDEMTGEDWRTRRVNMEDSIPLRHWHLNDPGVVPNLLQTFAGSPTGMAIYEGNLLPEKYRGQMLHTDAGPNVLRSYPVTNAGAGFSATINTILDGSKRDNWFRPSDVTVAPDGSIFVADWYDPGVGGHAMGDTDRGRIYRIAPKGVKYTFEKPDFESLDGNIKALQNPNVATRAIAWMNLHKMGDEAEGALVNLYDTTTDSRMKARALWLLSKLPENGLQYIQKALDDKDENIRVTAIRAANELKKQDITKLLLKMAADESSQVRREVALAIRYRDAKDIWLKLANAYNGEDRWYLEALGIAAEGKWNAYLNAYLEQHPDWLNDNAAKEIIWRSRGARTLDLLGQIIANAQINDKWKYYRAMDFQESGDKNSMLLSLLSNAKSVEEKSVIFKLLDITSLETYPKLLSEITTHLKGVSNEDFLDIFKKFKLTTEKNRLLQIVLEDANGDNINMAANYYMDIFGADEVKKLINQNDARSLLAIERFGIVDKPQMTSILIGIFQNKELPKDKRLAAMKAMNGWESEVVLWDLVKNGQVAEDMMDQAKEILFGTWHQDIREAAIELLGDKDKQDINVADLVKKSGDAKKGKEVFEMYCKACHLVNKEGVDFGPGLSQIGAKLSKDGLYNAIINPSEGMGFGYETQIVTMKDGSVLQGIITTKTENEVLMKLPGQAQATKYNRKDIKSIKESKVSLMPKFPLEEKDLVDLVTYLTTLK